LDQLGDERAPDEQQQDAEKQTEDQQWYLVTRQRRHRQDVVQAHGDVGEQDGEERAPESRLLSAGALLRLFGRRRMLPDEQAHRNEEQQDRAKRLEQGNSQQQRRGDGKEDAQDNGRAATGEDGDQALPAGQPGRGGPDHQRVVAAERQVHQDNPSQDAEILKHV